MAPSKAHSSFSLAFSRDLRIISSSISSSRPRSCSSSGRIDDERSAGMSRWRCCMNLINRCWICVCCAEARCSRGRLDSVCCSFSASMRPLRSFSCDWCFSAWFVWASTRSRRSLNPRAVTGTRLHIVNDANVKHVKRWHTTTGPDFLALLYPISHRSRSVVGRIGEFDLDRRDYRNYTDWNHVSPGLLERP